MGSKVDAVDRVRLKDIETEQIVCLCSFYSWAPVRIFRLPNNGYGRDLWVC